MAGALNAAVEVRELQTVSYEAACDFSLITSINNQSNNQRGRFEFLWASIHRSTSNNPDDGQHSKNEKSVERQR